MYHFKVFTSILVIALDVRSGEGKHHSIPYFLQSSAPGPDIYLTGKPGAVLKACHGISVVVRLSLIAVVGSSSSPTPNTVGPGQASTSRG